MGAMVYAIACICWGAIALLAPERLRKIRTLSHLLHELALTCNAA
ncbi:hypothetical protein [Nostoc sp.]